MWWCLPTPVMSDLLVHSGTMFLTHGSAIVQVNMSWQQIFSQPKNNIQTRKRLASFSEVSNDNGSVWDISINLVFTELTYHFLICTKVNTILIDLATVSVTLHSGYIIQIWYYENLFVQEKKSLQHKWKTSMFYMSFIYFKPSPSIESKLADIEYRRYWRRNSEISFSFEAIFFCVSRIYFYNLHRSCVKTTDYKDNNTKLDTLERIHFLRELCHDVFHLCTHLVSKLA